MVKLLSPSRLAAGAQDLSDTQITLFAPMFLHTQILILRITNFSHL